MNLYLKTAHIGALDLQTMWATLGHTTKIDSWSGHNHLLGWPTVPKDYDYAQVLDRDYCRHWYKINPQVHGYDAYSSFYWPLDVLLYESSGKPMIMNVPIRFQGDLFEHRTKETVTYLNNAPNLHIVANCKWEYEHCKAHGLKNVQLIRSVCNYSPRQTTHNGITVIDWDRLPTEDFDNCISSKEAKLNHPSLETLNQYKMWVTMAPYNCSTMSHYERVNAGVPQVYPHPDLLKDLSKAGMAMGQLTFAHKSGHDQYYPIDESFCDYYQIPSIKTFRTLNELEDIIYMSEYEYSKWRNDVLIDSQKQEKIAYQQWKELFSCI